MHAPQEWVGLEVRNVCCRSFAESNYRPQQLDSGVDVLASVTENGNDGDSDTFMRNLLGSVPRGKISDVVAVLSLGSQKSQPHPRYLSSGSSSCFSLS